MIQEAIHGISYTQQSVQGRIGVSKRGAPGVPPPPPMTQYNLNFMHFLENLTKSYVGLSPPPLESAPLLRIALDPPLKGSTPWPIIRFHFHVIFLEN